MQDALEIKDQDSLQRWLEDKPVEWAQLIALRAALRVFPLVLEVLENTERERPASIQALTLSVWRCLVMSSIARKYPTDDMRAAAHASAAFHASASASVRTASADYRAYTAAFTASASAASVTYVTSDAAYAAWSACDAAYKCRLG